MGRSKAKRSSVSLPSAPLEAARAVHAPTRPRCEWHHRRHPARAADDGRLLLAQLSKSRRHECHSTLDLACLACRAAHGAAVGWVEVAHARKRAALVLGKCERTTAVAAGQNGVSRQHGRVHPARWERRVAAGVPRPAASQQSDRATRVAGRVLATVPCRRRPPGACASTGRARRRSTTGRTLRPTGGLFHGMGRDFQVLCGESQADQVTAGGHRVPGHRPLVGPGWLV